MQAGWESQAICCFSIMSLWICTMRSEEWVRSPGAGVTGCEIADARNWTWVLSRAVCAHLSLSGATFHAGTGFKLGGHFVHTNLSYFQFHHAWAKITGHSKLRICNGYSGWGHETFCTIADAVSKSPGHLNSDHLLMLMSLATCSLAGSHGFNQVIVGAFWV